MLKYLNFELLKLIIIKQKLRIINYLFINILFWQLLLIAVAAIAVIFIVKLIRKKKNESI